MLLENESLSVQLGKLRGEMGAISIKVNKMAGGADIGNSSDANSAQDDDDDGTPAATLASTANKKANSFMILVIVFIVIAVVLLLWKSCNSTAVNAGDDHVKALARAVCRQEFASPHAHTGSSLDATGDSNGAGDDGQQFEAAVGAMYATAVDARSNQPTVVNPTYDTEAGARSGPQTAETSFFGPPVQLVPTARDTGGGGDGPSAKMAAGAAMVASNPNGVYDEVDGVYDDADLVPSAESGAYATVLDDDVTAEARNQPNVVVTGYGDDNRYDSNAADTDQTTHMNSLYDEVDNDGDGGRESSAVAAAASAGRIPAIYIVPDASNLSSFGNRADGGAPVHNSVPTVVKLTPNALYAGGGGDGGSRAGAENADQILQAVPGKTQSSNGYVNMNWEVMSAAQSALPVLNRLEIEAKLAKGNVDGGFYLHRKQMQLQLQGNAGGDPSIHPVQDKEVVVSCRSRGVNEHYTMTLVQDDDMLGAKWMHRSQTLPHVALLETATALLSDKLVVNPQYLGDAVV